MVKQYTVTTIHFRMQLKQKVPVKVREVPIHTLPQLMI